MTIDEFNKTLWHPEMTCVYKDYVCRILEVDFVKKKIWVRGSGEFGAVMRQADCREINIINQDVNNATN